MGGINNGINHVITENIEYVYMLINEGFKERSIFNIDLRIK